MGYISPTNSFGFLLICFTIVYWIACDSSLSKPDSKLENDLPPSFALDTVALQNKIIQNLAKVDSAINAQDFNKVHVAYRELGANFIDLQLWDSLASLSIDIIYVGFDTYDFSTPEETYHFFLDSMEASPDTIRGKIEQLLGDCYYYKGEIKKADYYFSKALSILKGKPSYSLARLYNMLGIVNTIKGDSDKAAAFYRESIKQNQYMKDTIELRKNYFNLGDAYITLGMMKEAEKSYKQGQTILPKNNGYYNFSLARLQLQKGDIQEGLVLAQKALEQVVPYNQTELEDEERYFFTAPIAEQLLAEALLANGRYEESTLLYEKVLNWALETYASGDRYIGKLYYWLGVSYQKRGLSILAFEKYHQALQVLVPGFTSERITELPIFQLNDTEVWIMEVLLNKGLLFRERFKKEGDLNDLKHGAAHLNAAVDLIHQIRLQFKADGSKVFLGDYSISFIEEAIRTNLMLFAETQDRTYQEKAFELAQRSSAFLLRESVSEQQALSSAGIVADSIAIYERLKKQVYNLRGALNLATAESYDSIETQLFQSSQMADRYLENLIQRYPKYHSLRYDLEPISIQDAQGALPDSTLAIQYFVGESQFMIFVFSKDQFEIIDSPFDTTLQKQIDQYRKTSADLEFVRANPGQAETWFLESSQYLYQKLVQPALDQLLNPDEIQRLIIIPDGDINHIVFEALLEQPVDTWTNTEGYLINRFAIHYAYYTGLLRHQEVAQIPSARFLGFGIEYDDQTLDALESLAQDSLENPLINQAFRYGKLMKLLFSDEEVLEISSLVQGKAFTNEEATKQNFLKFTPSYNAVHIAAHTFLAQEENQEASIVFNQSEPGQDNFLRIEEIYALDLNLQMIVLSACQTGTGTIHRSEGLISLARAFTIAGSESVVASHWNIPDQTTAIIMKRYYYYLNQGLSKDAALQKAKLDYLNDDQLSGPAFRIPAYWAANVLIGDPVPIHFEAVNTFRAWWILLGLGVGGLFFFVLRILLTNKK